MTDLVTVEASNHVLAIGVNRPEKRNAWNIEVIQSVANAYGRLDDDDDLRVGLVFGHGDDFTSGLDLPEVAPALAEGRADEILPPELPDPWDFTGEPCSKPIVVAVHGRCYTLGIELALASQVVVAATDTSFAQLEVARGITPLGGATFRLPQRLGSVGMWALLGAQELDAASALRYGLVTEVVETGHQLERAREMADMLAQNAPLAVQAALAQARAAERAGRDAAVARLQEIGPALLASSDAAEAITAMIERRPPTFTGA